MFKVVNDNVVIFNFETLENGDYFTMKKWRNFEYHYNVFKNMWCAFVVITKISPLECACEVERFIIDKYIPSIYYLDFYGDIQQCEIGSIRHYLLKIGKLPTDNIQIVTLDQLKETTRDIHTKIIMAKTNNSLISYKNWTTQMSENLRNLLKPGDELLVDFEGKYGIKHRKLLLTKNKNFNENVIEQVKNYKPFTLF